MASGHSRNRGVTLTELLVVLSIMVVLMSVLIPALGTFTHTSRVVVGADTLSAAFRQARYYAMTHDTQVIPFILRDKSGHLSCVYAYKVMTFNGTYRFDAAPTTWTPPADASVTSYNAPFTLVRQSVDLPQLQKGFFCFWVGAPTLDLDTDSSGTPKLRDQPFYELMYMRVKPPSNTELLSDSSRYIYSVIFRGVHNTAKGSFGGSYSPNADIYAVVGGTDIAPDTDENVTAADAPNYTLSGIGYSLPDQVMVDQVTRADNHTTDDNNILVYATITAQAGIFEEDGRFAVVDGGRAFGKNFFPVFLPIFMPDGRVSCGTARNSIGSQEVERPAVKGVTDLILRVIDKLTRETRYVTVRASGQVAVSSVSPPTPAYYDIYVPSDPSGSTTASNSTTNSTTNSSTSASTTSSNNSTSTSNSTTSSSTTSTGTGSTNSTTSSTTTTSDGGSTTASNSTGTTTSSSSSSNSSSSSSTNSASGGGGKSSSGAGTSGGDGG